MTINAPGSSPEQNNYDIYMNLIDVTICHLILKIMKIENKNEGTKIKKLIT